MARVVVIGGFAPSLVLFRRPLLAAMRARGHEVIAMAPLDERSGEIGRALDDMGVGFAPFELQRTGIDPRSDLAAIGKLARRLRSIRPSHVFSYTVKPVIYGSIAARLAGVPHRSAMITGLGYALGEARGAKQRMIALVARGLLRAGLAQTELLFVQNPDDERDLAGVLPKKLRIERVRGSGVDLSYYAASPVPEGKPTFLFVGRLLRDKGIFEFVEAARSVKARFQILGWLDPNPESVTKQQLDAWVRDGLVEYLGATDDVRPHLAAAHALILPSYREGTPRSVLEAMSMNRAVITTDAPGCRETVVDGESGILVPVRDAPALAAAAASLANDRAKLVRLAAAGRARAEALYDANAVAAGMLDAMDL